MKKSIFSVFALMIFFMAGTVQAGTVFKFDGAGNPTSTGVASIATGVGISTIPNTSFNVTANVQNTFGVTFNSTSLTWTIKEGESLATELTHATVTAPGANIRMTVGALADSSKMVQDLKSTTSANTIDTMYAITDIVVGTPLPPAKNLTTPTGNGLGQWFDTDTTTLSAQSINNKTFSSKAVSAADFDGCAFLTSEFFLWNRLEVKAATAAETYKDTFQITLAVDP